MTTSNRLGITELAETQNNRSATVNEAIAKLEAGATFFAANQVLLNAPPGSPAEGDLYVVGTAGSGAWSGHNENVAIYYNAAWLFFTPFEGMFAWDQTSNSLKRYDGADWVAFSSGSSAGDVVGPASAVDSRIAAFDGTTGKLLKDGGATIASLATAARQIISGAGLINGGDLSADRTLAVGAGNGITVNADDVAIDKATAAHIWANTSNKTVAADSIWLAAAPVTLTDAATIAVDMGTFLNAVVTLGGNRTLGQPSNTKNGQSGCIEIIQDGTGSRTLAYHSDWKFAGGTDPTLSTAAGSIDLLFYQVIAANVIYANLVKAIA